MRIRNLITAVASGNLRRGDRHDTADRRGPPGADVHFDSRGFRLPD
jgi:hypothetical protein